MNFSEALEALKEGKKVRRPNMPENDYIVINDFKFIKESSFLYCVLGTPDVGFLPAGEDLLAEDWEILEDEMLSAQIETFARNTFFCPYCLQWAQDVSKRDQVVKCVHCEKDVKLKLY